jgi:hypothetical protein
LIPLNEARDYLIINKNQLEEECLKQPELLFMIGENCAEAVSIRDELKELKDIKWSEEFVKIKLQTTSKLTDAMVKSMVDTSKEYYSLLMDYLEAKKVADDWIALRDSFYQRASMLKLLADFYLSGFRSNLEVKSSTVDFENQKYDTLKKKMRGEKNG